MHKFASFNHEVLSASDTKINAISSAALYGRGIFTTIAIYNSKPFLWEKHWRRLNDNAKKLGLDLSAFAEDAVENSLTKLIEKNEIDNGRCRITFFEESSNIIWQTSIQDKTSLLIQTADIRKLEPELSVYVSRYPTNSLSPLSGVKSNNYLENILALEDGRKYGFNEMIRYNENQDVVSFCMANIFWLEFDDETLYTPSLETGCLAGTTRELVIENFDVEEVKMEINFFFANLETIFITSTAFGVKRVTDVDGEKMNLRDHEVLKLIEKKLREK